MLEKKLEFEVVPYLFTLTGHGAFVPSFTPLEETPARILTDSPYRHAVREGLRDLSEIIGIDTGEMRYYTAPRSAPDIINLARSERGARVYEIKMVY